MVPGPSLFQRHPVMLTWTVREVPAVGCMRE
jgi:hypothetical protein